MEYYLITLTSAMLLLLLSHLWIYSIPCLVVIRIASICFKWSVYELLGKNKPNERVGG